MLNNLCKEAASKSNPSNCAMLKESMNRLLISYLNGECTLDEYENACRQQLGANSYVAFTLDWLVERLCKQILEVESSDTIDLYLYVRNRGCMSEEIYFALAKMMLPPEHRFRIVMSSEGGEHTALTMNIHFIYGEHVLEVQSRGFDEGSDNYLRNGFSREIKECTARMVLGGIIINSGHEHINVQGCTAPGSDRDLMKEERLELTHISNGMECEINYQTCKVSVHRVTKYVFFVWVSNSVFGKMIFVHHWLTCTLVSAVIVFILNSRILELLPLLLMHVCASSLN